MKYCSKCGKELVDDAVICTGCGRALEAMAPVAEEKNVKLSGLQIAAKVFMILGTIYMGFFLLPLAWCLPMTISYCRKIKAGEPIGVGFKICSLLFVSLLGGIFMLCDNDKI